MAIERKTFTGGLNSDTEDRLIPNGDYRYALNCRLSKSDGANMGAVENTKGNSLVGIELPEGTNKVIGAFDNLETNKVYYFLFNSKGMHSIYEFDAKTSTIALVIQTYLLNFKSNKFIDDPQMIDDILLFNDRYNPPRKINVDRAKNNNYPTPFKEEYINAVAIAPGFPPEVEYGDDSSVNSNNVRNKLFQFRYKFIYLDNEESAWSPISKVPLPLNEGQYRPSLYYPTNINNAIDIDIDTGNDTVKGIKIAVREGNTGDFYLAADLDKDKLNIVNQTYTYRFFNDEDYIPIDNSGTDGMRLFDYYPLKADSQALIDGNRIAYGGVTENYNPVDIDIDITVNREISTAADAPDVGEIIKKDTWKGFGSGEINPLYPLQGDLDWVIVTSDQARYIREINGQNYFFQSGRVAWRPSPTASPFKRPTISVSPGQLYSSPSLPFNKPNGAYSNRVLGLRPVDASASPIYVTESTLNEFYVDAPNAPGTRYVVDLVVEYYDLGGSNNIKKKRFKVQYTSIAGDTGTTVAAALRDKIKALGKITEGKVDIDFDLTNSSNTSISSSSFNGKDVVRVWTHAVVPASEATNPSGSWFPEAVGGDTAALYVTRCSVEAYADWTAISKKSLKSGATHGIGIVYYDSPNRSGLTNISSSKSFYVPFFSELAIPNGDIPNETSLSVKISNLAPEWAKRYQFVYTGNQTVEYLPGADDAYKGFIHFRLKDVNATASVAQGAINAKLTNIDNYNSAIPEDVGLNYSFSKGDRIRFIKDSSDNYYTDYRDVEIISYDSTSKVMEFKDPGIQVGTDTFVEVYTPKKQSGEEVVYYEIGESYEIVNRLHTSNQPGKNQTSLTPAEVLLEDIGDIYLRYRILPMDSIVESYSYSDYYDSDVWDKGRPNRVDDNINQIKRESTIRYSQPYLPDTNINGLSEFFDLSFEEYDQQYGSILRMHPEDKDLTIFQRLKVGKVRVGQDTLYSNEGSQIGTVKSQNTVLSDIVYYTGEFGIGTNPESFAVYGNRKYFTDAPRGAVLRLSTDGITPIHNVFMHNYFNDTFKRLIDNGGDFRLLGTYDVRFDEYLLSIQENIEDIQVVVQRDLSEPAVIIPSGEEPTDYSGSASDVPTFFSEPVSLNDEVSVEPESSSESASTASASSGSASDDLLSPAIVSPNLDLGSNSGSDDPIIIPEVEYLYETIAFSETKKRWVTFYSYIPDFMIANNISLITFKDGKLYKHNDNDVYNNFYGEQFTRKIKFLSNIEPDSIKFYTNIFTESTHAFSMPSATNQFGQKTSLIVDDFIDFEGVFKSEFLMNENTPNVENPLIEGENIRCHSLTIELEDSEVGFSKLFGVGIGVHLSQLTAR